MVVRHSSFNPFLRKVPIWCMRGTMSFLMVGSPPVSRILVTPCDTNRAERYDISGVVRRWAWGDSGTPSSGMQYVHRRLHRSVIDIRR